jgi:hypothetical protein
LFIRTTIFYAACLALLFLSSCQTIPPLAPEHEHLPALSRELGRRFEELEKPYQLRPPFSGFNQGRNLSRLNKPWSLAGLSFEVVLVFDQPERQGYLRGVEGFCPSPAADPEALTRIFNVLTSQWGAPQASGERQWHWEMADFNATLSAPRPESERGQATWLVSLEQKLQPSPVQSAQVMPTLAGWDRAFFGASLAELEKIYSLGQLGRSSLNDKPAGMVNHEVNYLGNSFKAAFFFDRFTPQALLTGVDLYLLEDRNPEQWLQKRDDMIESLSKLYGRPGFTRQGHRFIWTWKDHKGSLTFTDTSRGSRTTWLLSFRPGPGRITPPPALAAPRTYQDIAGWANVRVGMSPAQMELLYTGQAPAFIALAGSGYGFEYALQFEDLNFKVLFLFDRQSRPASLSQVVLSRVAPAGEEGRLEKRLNLMNMLTAWYGPPSQDLLDSKGGGKAVWLRPSGALEFHDMPEIKTWVLNYRSARE